eukprot:350311-Pleurochrysis_carterae.AAC.4
MRTQHKVLVRYQRCVRSGLSVRDENGDAAGGDGAEHARAARVVARRHDAELARAQLDRLPQVLLPQNLLSLLWARTLFPRHCPRTIDVDDVHLTRARAVPRDVEQLLDRVSNGWAVSMLLTADVHRSSEAEPERACGVGGPLQRERMRIRNVRDFNDAPAHSLKHMRGALWIVRCLAADD